jgi:PhnB protein
MKVVPYLNFTGNAEVALKFYEHALHGTVSSLMRYGDNPMPGLPEDAHQLIMHAELHIGENRIYVSDTTEPAKLIKGNNYTVHLDCDTEDEIRHLFDHLSEGAVVDMPLEDTFWGAIFGSLIDQFGIQWTLNYQKPE